MFAMSAQVLCEVLDRLLALNFDAGLAAVHSHLDALATCCRAEVTPYAGAVATMPELVAWLSAHAPTVLASVLRLGPHAGAGGASQGGAGLGSQGLGSQGPAGGMGAGPSGAAGSQPGASQGASQAPPGGSQAGGFGSGWPPFGDGHGAAGFGGDAGPGPSHAGARPPPSPQAGGNRYEPPPSPPPPPRRTQQQQQQGQHHRDQRDYQHIVPPHGQDQRQQPPPQPQRQTPTPEAPLSDHPQPYATRPSLHDLARISIAALKQFLREAGHWGPAEEVRFRGSMKEDMLAFALAGADGEPPVSQHARASTPPPLGVRGTTSRGTGKDKVSVAAKERDWEVRRLLACAELPVPGAFYAALRLPADEPPAAEDVTTAHKQLALLVHPDKFPDPARRMQADKACKILNAARDALLR